MKNKWILGMAVMIGLISGTAGADMFSVAASSGLPPQFDGYLDWANCSQVAGWAWDENQPNTPIGVTLFIDGNFGPWILANVYRADLVAAGKGNGQHGFVYTTPTAWQDGKSHVITAMYSGGGPLKKSPQTIQCAQNGSYLGYVDSVSCSQISGWAWNSAQPNSPIQVSVYDNGVSWMTISAANPRPDVQAAGFGNGVHGFAAQLGLHDGRTHQISVRYTGNNQDLYYSPTAPMTCN